MSHLANNIYLEAVEENLSESTKRELIDRYETEAPYWTDEIQNLCLNLIAEKEFECEECEDTGETWIDVDDTQFCTCSKGEAERSYHERIKRQAVSVK